MELIFQESAVLDFNVGISYYESINTNLSDKFREEVFDYLDSIKNFEKIFQVRYREIRIAPLKKFPYSIHYFTEKNRIVITAIKHQRQFYQ